MKVADGGPSKRQLPKKFSLLEDAFELLFENVKPLVDVFEILASGENNFS